MSNTQSDVIYIGANNAKALLAGKAFSQKIYEKAVTPKKLSVFLQYINSGSDFSRFKGIGFVFKIYGPAHNKKGSKVENQIFIGANGIQDLVAYYTNAKYNMLARYHITRVLNCVIPDTSTPELFAEYERRKIAFTDMFINSTEPIGLMRHVALIEDEKIDPNKDYDHFTLSYQPMHKVGTAAVEAAKPWIISLNQFNGTTLGEIDGESINFGNTVTSTTLKLSTTEFYQLMDSIISTITDWQNNCFKLRRQSIR